MAGASTEEDNSDIAVSTKDEEELRRNNMERWMEAAASDLEIRTEDAAEVAKISERGMKEAIEEAEVKYAAAQRQLFRIFLWDLVCRY